MEKRKLNTEEIEQIVGGSWQDKMNAEERERYYYLCNRLSDLGMGGYDSGNDWQKVLEECNAFKAKMIAKYGD